MSREMLGLAHFAAAPAAQWTVMKSPGGFRAASIAVLLCCLGFSVAFQGAQAMSTQEENALLAIRDSVVEDPFGRLGTWSNTDPCQWVGVACNDMGWVVALRVLWSNISAIIPPEIGDLVHLQELSLTGNWLTGPIPDSIANLTALVTLDLSFNRNDLQDPDDEFDFTNPDFHGVNGTIPAGISKLQLLETLSLNNNRLSGSIPPELGSLNRLTSLTLGANNLSGPLPPELGRLGPQLGSFNIASNKISGAIPKELGNLTGLVKDLTLGVNQFEGSIPAELGNLVKLLSLDVRDNLLTGEIPPSLGGMAALNILHLETNMLTGSIPAELGNCKNLGFIFASNNRLNGSIPEQLGFLTDLQKLQLDNNSLNGAIPSSITALPNLTRLDVSTNQLEGGIPDNWAQGCVLNTLLLRDNRLKGALPRSLSNCQGLILMDLRNNNLNGSIPDEYEYINKLRVLVLSKNSLTGAIPPSITHLSRLQVLALPGNKLEGSIPADLSGLSAFQLSGSLQNSPTTTLYEEVLLEAKGQSVTYEYILKTNTFFDLSSNNLTGNITSEVGGYMFFLRVLNLSYNSLEDQIPTSLGNLSEVESMDLSNNRLSGNIPVSLARLTFLTVFRVANNSLSGPIPTGGQFSTFHASDFLGNAGLCGPPSNVTCGNAISDDGAQGQDQGQALQVDKGGKFPVSLTALCIGLGIGFIGASSFMYANRRTRSYIFRTGDYSYEPAYYVARHGLYKTPNVWTQ